jgi:hypothetical protein
VKKKRRGWPCVALFAGKTTLSLLRIFTDTGILLRILENSVSDPYWFRCRSGSGTSILDHCGAGSRSRVLMTKRLKNFTPTEKILYFFDQKFQFTRP